MNKTTIIIIAVALLVVFALFFFLGKKEEKAEPAPGAFQPPFMPAAADQACSKYFNQLPDLENKIKLLQQEMASNPEWMETIEAQTGQSWHDCGGGSLEECKRINAIWTLAQQGWCIPQNFS